MYLKLILYVTIILFAIFLNIKSEEDNLKILNKFVNAKSNAKLNTNLDEEKTEEVFSSEEKLLKKNFKSEK